MKDFMLQLDPRGLSAIAIKASLLLTFGWIVTLLLRRSSAVARHTVWLCAIVGAVVIPALGWFGPIRVPVLAPVAAVAAPPVSDIGVNAQSSQPIAGVVLQQHATVTSWDVATIVAAVWFGVAFVLIVRMLLGILSVHRLVGRARTTESWQQAVATAGARVGLARQPAIVISNEVDVAFTCNAFGPTIVLPTAADEWSDELRQSVLAHELAHIKRRDLLGQLAAMVACAMYWFNPLVWGAANRLRKESEIASDDMVLATGVRPSEYAQHLLNLVATLRQEAPRAAIAVARPRELEGRLIAILDRARLRSALGGTPRFAIVAALSAFTLSVATVVPVPRTMDVITSGAVPEKPIAPADTPSVPMPHRGVPARLSDAGLSMLLRAGTAALINPMQLTLRYADSLQLTGMQADSLATLGRTYAIALDKLWRPVLRYYATHAVEDESPFDDPLNGAHILSITTLMALAPAVHTLLTTDQMSMLPDDIRRWLEGRELAALRERARSVPDVVFQIPQRAGPRMGEGGITRRPAHGRAG